MHASPLRAMDAAHARENGDAGAAVKRLESRFFLEKRTKNFHPFARSLISFARRKWMKSLFASFSSEKEGSS